MLKEWKDKWDQCCRNKLNKINPVVGEKHWDHINYTRCCIGHSRLTHTFSHFNLISRAFSFNLFSF